MSYTITHVSVPKDVIFREIAGEAVILNMTSEEYLGLDEVGVRMWTLLTESETVQVAYDSLLEEYDVEPSLLRVDLEQFMQKLVDKGVLNVNATA